MEINKTRMTVQRKIKRRSNVRIRRLSQPTSSSYIDANCSTAVAPNLIEEPIPSCSVEEIGPPTSGLRMVSTVRPDTTSSVVVSIPEESSEPVEDVRVDAIETFSKSPETEERSETQPTNPLALTSVLETTIQQQNTTDIVEDKALQSSAQTTEPEPNKAAISDSLDSLPPSIIQTPDASIDFLMHDFLWSPPTPTQPEEVAWDLKIERQPLSRGHRVAKYTTIAMVVSSLLGISSFVAYHQFVIPTPVALGMTSKDVALPKPIELMAAKEMSGVALAQAPLPQKSTSSQIQKDSKPKQPDPVSPTTTAPSAQPTPSDKTATNGQLTAGVETQYKEAIEKAVALSKQSQRGKAKKEFERALEINPNGAEALSKLAFISLEAGKYRDALEMADRAVAIDPTSSEGWIVLGAARQATADRKGATEAYKRCSELSGEFVKECKRLLR